MSETWQGCLLPPCCSKLFWKYQPVPLLWKKEGELKLGKAAKIIILELETQQNQPKNGLETVELKREVETHHIQNQYLSYLLTS